MVEHRDSLDDSESGVLRVQKLAERFAATPDDHVFIFLLRKHHLRANITVGSLCA